MTDDPMYLKKHDNGVYYYRRPIIEEDQVFWRGPSGGPKREWSRSLRTKDRRTAISFMTDAADAYEAERAAACHEHAVQEPPANIRITQRAQEEQEAAEAITAARQARHDARREVRQLLRMRMSLSTAELTVEEAAARDLIREKEQDQEELKLVVAKLTAGIEKLGGGNLLKQNQELPTGVGTPHTIEDLIVAYEADKSPGWSGSSKKAVVPVFRVLRDVFPGRRLGSISREEAREVVKLLTDLPTQIGKRKVLAGLTVPQAVEKGRELNLPTIQPKTVNDGYLLHIASMFNWACKEQWINTTPFSGLAVHDPVDDADRRDPFSAEQLVKLFSSHPWTTPWKTGGAKPGAYWVPLLCLFHGLRNGEAAGLRLEDIGEDDGTAVIRIRGYLGRSIKNKEGRGTLAIHPELIRMGFLAYAAERQNAGEILLFPEGVANSRGQVGAKLGERFTAHIRKLGLLGRKLGTHSFRHCFEDRLREAELAERTALALARRSEPGSSRVYGDGLSSRHKAEAIEKIQYSGLDLSHLYFDNAVASISTSDMRQIDSV